MERSGTGRCALGGTPQSARAHFPDGRNDAEPLLAESRHGAWRTSVALGDEHEARLIVTGSHGISPAASKLLGSVAAGIVHHAARPVLVVPAPHRS